ncbi:hypothetical protein [Janibacter cremeus]|uniref:Uncharacterized protein n=1 Tax=Janibacter cremeus TaxID=1285192 RepID=A0A852VTZ2_9MICO|nr:hypothetical protein [Janibacter cremeus]NYF97285.1 hypothetical protein [Janibacter cremeus]
MSAQTDDRAGKARETIIVIVLSLTAVLTAWSGFESSKWGGNMSINFSKASAQRIEASRQATHADAARAIDLQIFGIYLKAVAEDDQRLADFAQERFTPHFEVAFKEWKSTKPLTNPSAPKSPFQLDSYLPPGSIRAATADERADALFQEGLDDNARGDRYTLLTVLFALVLFFAAFTTRIESRVLAWALVTMTSVLMIVGIAFLAVLPKLL